MQSSARARRLGRQLRRDLDPDLSLTATKLVAALCDYLKDRGVEVFRSPARRLRGRRACIKPGKLDYDQALEDDPSALLHALAHETGHALQHGRVHGLFDFIDPAQVMTLAADQRGLAEARYSPVSRDEFQAEAFAVEFTCPSDLALSVLRGDPDATSHTVAERFSTTLGVARAQLGEALHDAVYGPPSETSDEPNLAPASDREPNDKQQEAISHRGTAALVDAGPGCGKTFTLVERIARSLETAVEEAREERIVSDDEAVRIRRETAARTLVLTFSTEAAGELEHRIATRLRAEEAQEVHVATFHGFGRQILAEHGSFLGVSAKASVLDEDAQVQLVLRALSTPGAETIVDLKDPESSAREAVRHIQYLKHSLVRQAGRLTPWTSDLLRSHLDALDDCPAEAHALATVFAAYEAQKGDLDAVDFADLVALPIRVLRDRPAVAAHYQVRYRHVLVDEFQDVSRSVSLFLELLCEPDGEPWVVGDPNQAIYRFLNADPQNVARFPETFTGAAVFELESNYRSAPEIVAVANRLASLLRQQRDPTATPADRFVAVGSKTAAPAAVGHSDAVAIAVAESDRAEREGVVATVAHWIASGVAPHDIAVLARRNIDVREIALVLGQEGIKTAAGTVMTPDGTAGDLVAAVSFADGRAGFRSALPRIVYGLSRGRHSVEFADRAVAWMLSHVPRQSDGLDDALDALAPPDEIESIVLPVIRLHQTLRRERYRGDAFSMLAAFLFDGSDYVRRLLEDADQDALAQASAVLRRAEASTTLAQAAAYRHAHPIPRDETAPCVARTSRLDFAAAFRRALASGIPSAVTPPRVEGAVQVMTCHAAKGLEFPYVCVVGQTLSPLTSGFGWLPDSLQPDLEQDQEQADALLFVGATRAQNALVVSYSERASAGRGRLRTVTSLLERWLADGNTLTLRWSDPEDVEDEPTDQPARWGRGGAPKLSVYHLDKSTCEVATYLEQVAHLRFPEATPPLYPLYVDRLRRTIQAVIRTAHASGKPVPEDAAHAAFERAWASTAKLYEDHPLVDLYGRLGMRAAISFAVAYSSPLATSHAPIDASAIESGLDGEGTVSLGLLDAFYADDGQPIAFVLRTESYASKSKDGTLNWSALSTPSRQIPLALFHEHPTFRGLSPRVLLYSASDGALYDVKWSTRKTGGQTSMERLQAQANGRSTRLAVGPYTPGVSAWKCPRCRSRVLCPHYLSDLFES